jgi:nicotinate-nucleotide pyrophosphorylase (carboxylating)
MVRVDRVSERLAGEPLSELVARALAEDVGEGDRTTEWTVPRERQVSARIIAKQHGVIAGLDAAREVFRQVDPGLRFEAHVDDGAAVEAGDVVIRLEGAARGVLTGERVALNFLQRLSGVATLTRQYVDAVSGTGVRLLDTRKTTPGLRALEKAAVRAGGGTSHRFGLFDMVLVKENHVAAAGGIATALDAVRRHNRARLHVEVETTTLDEVDQALAAGADRILFDNMPLPTLQEAVSRVARAGTGRPETEASGGVSLSTIAAIAATGVDYISVGALTHSAPALDLSLLIDVPA